MRQIGYIVLHHVHGPDDFFFILYAYKLFIIIPWHIYHDAGH